MSEAEFSGFPRHPLTDLRRWLETAVPEAGGVQNPSPVPTSDEASGTAPDGRSRLLEHIEGTLTYWSGESDLRRGEVEAVSEAMRRGDPDAMGLARRISEQAGQRVAWMVGQCRQALCIARLLRLPDLPPGPLPSEIDEAVTSLILLRDSLRGTGNPPSGASQPPVGGEAASAGPPSRTSQPTVGPMAASQSPRKTKSSGKISAALAELNRNPGLTNREIAVRVGCNPNSLTNDVRFKNYRAMLRADGQSNIPRGRKRDGRTEASGEDRESEAME
jgi:hypothetical protein